MERAMIFFRHTGYQGTVIHVIVDGEDCLMETDHAEELLSSLIRQKGYEKVKGNRQKYSRIIVKT